MKIYLFWGVHLQIFFCYSWGKGNISNMKGLWNGWRAGTSTLLELYFGWHVGTTSARYSVNEQLMLRYVLQQQQQQQII